MKRKPRLVVGVFLFAYISIIAGWVRSWDRLICLSGAGFVAFGLDKASGGYRRLPFRMMDERTNKDNGKCGDPSLRSG
jgi:hypothetical protein